jgi:hypothetical protein
MKGWIKWTMAGLVLLIIGCGGGGGGGGDNTPPNVTDVQVNPTMLSFRGGSVKISAVVSDASGIDRVWAVVQRPDGWKREVTLSPAGNARYEGEFPVESNLSVDGQSVIYRVWVRARDMKGNETPEPGEPKDGRTVEVTAPLKPEKPPF